MKNINCAECNKLLDDKHKTCCSQECKIIWFGKRQKKENPKWTDEYSKNYYIEYRKKNKEKARLNNIEWRKNNVEHVNLEKRKERAKLKNEVLNHYSNGKMCCENCGFSDIRALQLDHINNNGAQERKEVFGSRTCAGTTFYRWVRRQGFPVGYGVLCANCNIIKLREFENNGQ